MVRGPELRQALKERLTDGVVTRFAPAPTGALHLGHVVNAVFVWGLARALAGRVILRVEDHDRQRARIEWERQILDDLDWLGLAPDIYPTNAYREQRCDGRQSERDALYRQRIAPLIARGMVYGCRCTRASQQGDDAPAASSAASSERRYPGTCRDAGIPLGGDVGWRLRIEPGLEAFDDGLMGRQEQEPAAQCGDLLLRDRLGNWTYQCVAALDDTVQGVTLVVRGQDLLPSTARQIRLARLVGRRTPAVYVHHPLVMKSATQKLSKSDGDTGIRDLRVAGWTPERILGHAAALAGLAPSAKLLGAAELSGFFE